jgi:hypothetical protein
MPLQTAGGRCLLLRVRTAEPIAGDELPLDAALALWVNGTREGIVVTDMRGQLMGANRGFVHMVNAADEEAVRGHFLSDWLGPDEAGVAELLRAVRASGIAQDRPLTLRVPGHPLQAMAVSGMLLIEGDQECLGFILRPQTDAPAASPAAPSLVLSSAIEALTEGLGRTPLLELVRNAEQLVRQHLVQRAIGLAGSDAAAALLLGVSPKQFAQLKNELDLDATASRHPAP